MIGPLVLLLAQAAPVPDGPFVLLDRIAAVVGDDVVVESEIDRIATVEVVPRRAGEDDDGYRDRILSDRIDEIVQEQQLRRTGGVDPDPREVQLRLDDLKARLAKAPGGTLEQRMARARVSEDDVRSWIRRGLMLTTYVRERISPTIKTTDAELRTFFEGPFRSEARERGLEALPSFAEVQDRLRELLRERKLSEAVTLWTKELRESSRILIYRRPGRAGSPAPASR